MTTKAVPTPGFIQMTMAFENDPTYKDPLAWGIFWTHDGKPTWIDPVMLAANPTIEGGVAKNLGAYKAIRCDRQFFGSFSKISDHFVFPIYSVTAAIACDYLDWVEPDIEVDPNSHANYRVLREIADGGRDNEAGGKGSYALVVVQNVHSLEAAIFSNLILEAAS